MDWAVGKRKNLCNQDTNTLPLVARLIFGRLTSDLFNHHALQPKAALSPKGKQPLCFVKHQVGRIGLQSNTSHQLLQGQLCTANCVRTANTVVSRVSTHLTFLIILWFTCVYVIHMNGFSYKCPPPFLAMDSKYP